MGSQLTYQDSSVVVENSSINIKAPKVVGLFQSENNQGI